MSNYSEITLARYMRVIVRQCITFHDLGFSDKAIDALLDIAVEEAIRLVNER